MSSKASKNALAELLGAGGTNGLIAHETPSAPTQIIKTGKEHAVALDENADQDNRTSVSMIDEYGHPTNSKVPTKPYRSQGLTIYDSDDELIDEFVAYLRKKKMRIGRKKGFSLFARAGLRALEAVRLKNPVAFEEFLVRALHEQK
jgi:hypothetical protein